MSSAPGPALQPDDRYRTLARLVQGYVFEARLTADGQVEFTWADDQFADIFGCERDEVNRRGWRSFIDPRDEAQASRCLAEVAAGTTTALELRVVSATGQRRWLRMAAEPIREPQSGRVTGVIGMAEDITQRKVLMEQMFESVNREQRRIGNDLHDELGQVLTGASLLLRACHTNVIRGVGVTACDLDRVMHIIAGAIESTRLLAHGLAPGTLDGGCLTSALENLASHARRWAGLEILFTPSPDHFGGLDASTSDHLYRIAQEAITNIARHAHAARAEIATRVADDELVIDVSDDGIGIADRVTQGFGLRTMRYRAQTIGAQLSVTEVSPHGTRVSVRLPLRSALAVPREPPPEQPR